MKTKYLSLSLLPISSAFFDHMMPFSDPYLVAIYIEFPAYFGVKREVHLFFLL
jgi:hypothetical protein